MTIGKKVLGMDIGGTHMRLGLVDKKNRLTHFTIQPTQKMLGTGEPIEQMAKVLKAYLKEHCETKPVAVSIGVPSTVDKTRRVVVSTPNIGPLQNLQLAKHLEAMLEIPVFVNRDVNFLMLYDMLHHGLHEAGTVLGFYIGTGLGNAICIGGRLLLGANGMAAELGHIPIAGNHKVCGCGNIGCVETLASGLALARLQKEFFAQTPMGELFLRHKKTPELISFVDYLSIPIAAEVSIFDPDNIIIGGGVVQMAGFPTEQLEEKIRLHTRKPEPAGSLRVLWAVPQQENGVIGAGIYAFKRMEGEDYL